MRLSYFYLILALTIVDTILLIVAMRNSAKKAVRSFAYVMLLLIVAHVFYGTSLLIPESELKYTIHELKFLGVAFFSLAFYSMYMDLFDKREMLKRKYKLLLSIIPACSVLAAATNNFHHLFRTRLYTVENRYGSFIGVQSGPLFWVYITYSYLLYIFVIGYVVRLFIKTPRIYRMKLGIMVFAAIATLIINFISISNLLFEDFGDATLISFTIAAIIQFYGLVMYKPVRMIRAARDMAVNEIKDPLIIFDYREVFLDANSAAREIFSFSEEESLSGFLSRTGLPDADSGQEFQRGEHWYTIQLKKIYDGDGVYAASAILLSDISEFKHRAKELEHLAIHDYLTGIANRHAYIRELMRITDQDLPVTLVRMNISGMKLINNMYGNEAGDNVIRKVAGELSVIRDSAFCARIEGDEFALILRCTTEADAQAVMKELAEKLPGVTLISGMAVKQSNMDNINIVNKTSMDHLYMNKLISHSGSLHGKE